MYPFFESIAIIDGLPRNLYFHQFRVDQTFHSYYKNSESHHLEYLISKISFIDSKVIKLKFTYNQDSYKFSQIPYKQKIFEKFTLIKNDQLNYDFKFSDRKLFEITHTLQKTNEQTVFIKHGEITDSSLSNLIFYDGFRWLTPVNPLLKGTMRHSLLASMSIFEEYIKPADLKFFKHFKLINAMNSMEESLTYPIELIDSNIISV